MEERPGSLENRANVWVVFGAPLPVPRTQWGHRCCIFGLPRCRDPEALQVRFPGHSRQMCHAEKDWPASGAVAFRRSQRGSILGPEYEQKTGGLPQRAAGATSSQATAATTGSFLGLKGSGSLLATAAACDIRRLCRKMERTSQAPEAPGSPSPGAMNPFFPSCSP